jgi:L-ribulose-5-phosphate 3-epimerase
MIKFNRREFIRTSSIAAAGTIAIPKIFAGTTIPNVKPYPICIFTKCLQFLDYDQLGETIAKVGFDGADLSVRNGGHVLPENIKIDLPKAIKSLQRAGISVPMMVTDINNPNDPGIERILGTASELGIKHYRMAYLHYDPAKSIQESLDMHKRTIEKLEKINRKFRIHGEYQNHSGTLVGSPVWDIYWLLKDSDPAYIGSQYDIHHATDSGGKSWPLGMKLLAPWIKTTAIKDFLLKKENDNWKTRDVPLGQGMVDYNAYLVEYKKLGINGPVSVHYEYDLGGAELGKPNPDMGLDKILDYLKSDLNWLKMKFNEHGI